MNQKMLGKYLLFVFFFITFCLLCRTIFILSQTLTPDFSVYYTAAQNMLAGNSVYVGHTTFTLFAYPLVSTLPFLVFLLLPYQPAQVLFLLISTISLALISFLIPYLITKKRSLLMSTIIFSLSYISFPTKFTLGMGQINLIAYALLVISFVSFKKKKLFFVALFFTLACICKPILGFTLLFFIINRQWKVILYSLGFFALWFWLPLLFDKNALMDYAYYVQHVLPSVSKPVGREIYYNQGISAFIFRLTTNQAARVFLDYIGMVTIFITGLFIAIKQRKNQLYQWGLLLTMIPLLDPMSWQHHFIVLIFPFTYAAFIFYKQKQYKHLVILAFANILVSLNIKTPQPFMHFPENFLLSNTFYGAVLLFLLFVFKQKLFQKNG